MDIARVFMSLRPDATFNKDYVNWYSLDTIAATYTGVMPTQKEMDAQWVIIQLEDTESERINSIKTEANKRILKVDPAWTVENHEQKQRNDLMIGEGILLDICKAINSGVQADIDASIAVGNAAVQKATKIKAIRDMSNLAETNGDSLTKFQSDLDAAGY